MTQSATDKEIEQKCRRNVFKLLKDQKWHSSLELKAVGGLEGTRRGREFRSKKFGGFVYPKIRSTALSHGDLPPGLVPHTRIFCYRLELATGNMQCIAKLFGLDGPLTQEDVLRVISDMPDV